jgi:CheY-like chemotaxis protein
LVEDTPNDVLLVRRAFQKAKIPNPLQVVSTGEEAILYLRGDGPYANRDEFPLPALVLLDLKLPLKDGFEVLRWIRAQPIMRALRVVVLTSSERFEDLDRACRLGANSILVKPQEFSRLVEVMAALKGYWMSLSAIPLVSRPPRTATRDLP